MDKIYELLKQKIVFAEAAQVRIDRMTLLNQKDPQNNEAFDIDEFIEWWIKDRTFTMRGGDMQRFLESKKS